MTDPERPRRAWWWRALPVALPLVLVGGLGVEVLRTGARVERELSEVRRRAGRTTTTVVRTLPPVITAVRQLSRLETAQFHVERVIDLTDRQEALFGLIQSEDAILLVAAADVTAGVDLARLRDEDVTADPARRTARLRLPAPEVFTTAIDHARTHVHRRTTDVLARRHEDLETRARRVAEGSLRDAALEGGLLRRAREGAERSVRALVRSLGYETVVVTFVDVVENNGDSGTVR